MSPFAMHLLGNDPAQRRRQAEHAEGETEGVQQIPDQRTMRPSRRALSYYNTFQTSCATTNDDPPAYPIAARQRPTARRHFDGGKETLPKYTCTVEAEGRMLLQLECINPLHAPAESEWREVYMVLSGTMISFYRVKDGGRGKLLRSYTLQHSEVGLAIDTQHVVLVPQTRLAQFIPSAARRRAWQKDPGLFRAVRQHILRLRVETDQLVLADPSEERVHSLIHTISAGIDISSAIDERNIPRQCTVPRRRRRQRNANATDINDPSVLAEQERILRDMYPAFAEQTPDNRPELERTNTATSGDVATAEPPPSAGREDDELDLAVIREDFATHSVPSPDRNVDPNARPSAIRQTTSTSVNSAFSSDMMYATSPSNFDISGKWQPPHSRTPQQVQRYVRRCMPILLAEAVRASDVLICSGRRVKVNWRMELLEEWELKPPSYKNHGFDPVSEPESRRSISQNSANESGNNENENAQTSTSMLGNDADDQIAPADTSMPNLDLTKIPSHTSKNTPAVSPTAKTQPTRHPGPDIHGVVFCF